MTRETVDYREGIERWFAASVRVDVSADPLASAPAGVQAEVFENRARNDQGLCFRSDCGQPLWDDHACAEHAEHASKGEQLEARMKRLTTPKRHIRRYY
jgi:hypothetical protein